MSWLSLVGAMEWSAVVKEARICSDDKRARDMLSEGVILAEA